MAKKKRKVILETVAGPSTKQQKDWETEEAMRTMMRAEEIKRDKPMMKRVSAMMKMKRQDMDRIMTIRGQQGRS